MMNQDKHTILVLKSNLKQQSSLCDHSDAYGLVKGNIAVTSTAAAGADVNKRDKKVILRNCAPFTDYISEINNTQVDHAKYINVVMSMYNLIEYSDNYFLNIWKLMAILERHNNCK